MMPPFVVFPTNRIAHFVEVSLYLFYLAQRVKLTKKQVVFQNCIEKIGKINIITPIADKFVVLKGGKDLRTSS